MGGELGEGLLSLKMRWTGADCYGCCRANDVGVVVLGCAGMAGMEDWVRSECGSGVRVVDGVKAGIGMLQGMVRGGF